MSCVCIILYACQHAFRAREPLPQFLPSARLAFATLDAHVHECLMHAREEEPGALGVARRRAGESAWGRTGAAFARAGRSGWMTGSGSGAAAGVSVRLCLRCDAGFGLTSGLRGDTFQSSSVQGAICWPTSAEALESVCDGFGTSLGGNAEDWDFA